jgi:hypothetical protein
MPLLGVLWQAQPAPRCAANRDIQRCSEHNLLVLKSFNLLKHFARQSLTHFEVLRPVTGRMFANDRKRGIRVGEGVEEKGCET